jgi:nucleoside-diphosphate-sugar epimerase
MDVRCFYSETLQIAITGGTGFVGQKLITLSDGRDFKRIDLEAIPIAQTIIHAAAKIGNNFTDFTDTLAIDHFVFDTAKKNNHKILYCSTNNVYPMTQSCDIHTNVKANEYYSLSKINGEMLLRDVYKIPYGIIRIGDVFGKGQKHGNFFKALEFSLLQNKPLNLYGSGLKIRNYILIDELANFILYLTNRLQNHELSAFTVNAAYHEAVSVAEIVNYIHQNTNLPVNLVPVQHDQSHKDLRTLDTRELLGYQFKHKTMWGALDHYISECQKG